MIKFFVLLMSILVGGIIECASGPNHLQAAPFLKSAIVKGSSTVITGCLRSKNDTRFLIQFFENPRKRNVTEGRKFLRGKIVKTNAEGRVSFKVLIPKNLRCDFVSATATRLQDKKLTDTSEFSESIQVASK